MNSMEMEYLIDRYCDLDDAAAALPIDLRMDPELSMALAGYKAFRLAVKARMMELAEEDDERI